MELGLPIRTGGLRTDHDLGMHEHLHGHVMLPNQIGGTEMQLAKQTLPVTAFWFPGSMSYIALKNGGAPCTVTFTSRTSTNPAFEGTSKRRRGYPSETHVKRGAQIIHGDKELVEKLGRYAFGDAHPPMIWTGCGYPWSYHFSLRLRAFLWGG
jgi:hypothetical protein